MFILKFMKTQKTFEIVGTAATREEAEKKVALARENGKVLHIEEIQENTELFKERDYDEDFRKAVQTFTETARVLYYFDTSKLKMSQDDLHSCVKEVVSIDFDNVLRNICERDKISLYVGDYGYGRSLEWYGSSEGGEWVSSSANC